MKSLDDMPVNDLIRLYYEKHHALRHGHIEKLILLKKEYPELFTAEKDQKIRRMIQSVKKFQASNRYKALQQQALRKKLSVISNDSYDEENEKK